MEQTPAAQQRGERVSGPKCERCGMELKYHGETCTADVWDIGCTTMPKVGDLHYVWCWACHAQSAMHLTREAAMAHWNRRRYVPNIQCQLSSSLNFL